jgi:hypothetical protein
MRERGAALPIYNIRRDRPGRAGDLDLEAMNPAGRMPIASSVPAGRYC